MAASICLSIPSYKSSDNYFESLLSEKQIDPLERLSYEFNRVSTFNNWPPFLKVRPLHLAKAGFFYQGHSDEVMCYECKAVISNWTQKETRGIDDEHLRVSPNCSMVQTHGDASTNVPLLTPWEAVEKSRPIPRLPEEGPMLQFIQNYARKHGKVLDCNGSTKSLPVVGASRSTQSESTRSMPGSVQQINVKKQVQATSSRQDLVPVVGCLMEVQQLTSPTPRPQATYVTTEASIPDDQILRLNDSSIYGPEVGSPNYNGSDLFRYKSETERLKTFDGWPSDSPVLPADLARSGFYFLHEADKVRCIFCHGMLRSWEPGDVVHEEHQRHFSSCPFIQRLDVGNIPCVQKAVKPAPATKQPTLDVLGVSTERPKNAQQALEFRRLESFVNWPKGSSHKPADLAKAGFFYPGSGNDDRVRCFFCDGGLQNWVPGDDPFREHATWFPKCVYINQKKGEDYVKKVQEEKMRRQSLIESGQPDAAMMLPDDIAQKAKGRIQNKEPPFKDVHEVVDAISKLTDSTPDASSLSAAGNDIASKSKKKNKNKKKKKKKVNANTEAVAKGETPEQTKGTASPVQGEGEHESTGDEDEEARLITATQLTESQKKIAESLECENQQLRDQRTCKVCMDKEVSLVFLPCGHLVCCTDCGNNVSKCPICRNVIRGTIRIYLN